ncbi:MAG TPA: PH domain-containing protein [Candidatus Hydrogenedentes bacterium]|nr:PH domain-containing protein [Candidatus Hydrogenedentota bacterium]HOM47330.1 PH domain-containing protein [Candidatus Hydrogenedentota bacterium]HOR49724.1 PH domain-containing protein [Candidatus Hydrogenedentota bacterium]HPK23846.1 PH domain-containing protein [Candidatus Hydrogenedentota bacterium]HPX87181.1 PH domain-containing protein [Candidatus Hydrogenedentota bacterium]
MVVLYAWVWLRLRPKQFIVHQDGLDVLWPLKRVQIPRADISSVRLISRQDLKNEIVRGVRIGAGGLWGSFGWLWTRRRGVIQMYVSRTDNFVWIECAGARPWLITPEQPEAFVRALSR